MEKEMNFWVTVFVIAIFISGAGVGFSLGYATKALKTSPTECSIFTEQKRCEEMGGTFRAGMDFYTKMPKDLVYISCYSESVDLFKPPLREDR